MRCCLCPRSDPTFHLQNLKLTTQGRLDESNRILSHHQEGSVCECHKAAQDRRISDPGILAYSRTAIAPLQFVH